MFGALVNATLTTLLGIVVPGGILGRYLSGRAAWHCRQSCVWSCGVFALDYKNFTIMSWCSVCGAVLYGRCTDCREGAGTAGKRAVQGAQTYPGRQAFEDRAFRRYVGFWVAWNYYYLASPFNAKYCLGPLGMSFTQFTVCCNYLYYAITLCSLPFWGSFIDRFGCRKTIYVAFSGIGAVGCLWLFAKPGQMLVPVLFYGLGGTVWCVVELLNQHMMISQTPEEGRQQYVAVYSTCALVLGQGMATLAGGVVMGAIHGWIGEGRLPVAGLALDKYQLLFILASFLRFL
ncbi:MAG: hypothetical protein ACLSBB_15340 [Ruthenibacterium lactatiformans]